jgi:hypothetical protein
MAATATDGMYVDYTIPLGLYDLLQGVITANQGDPNTPQIASPPSTQQWFSQPRPGNDVTTEVIQVNFKLPFSVSEVGWEELRTSCHTEVWYQDRQNNWRQVLDDNRTAITLNLSTAGTASWYTAHYYCYPIVAKALQFRITRVFDPQVGKLPYCVGLRNALIRRNIYTRSDGTQGIEPQQDELGNVITSYIKDWDASKAIDNDPTTFWRSMPLPDPNAVCSLYLDVRTPAGGTQLVDSLYIDPIYINQNLNLYYSNDDTALGLKLSPVSAVPTFDEDTQWQSGIGRWDISSPSEDSTADYEFPMAWGPLVSQDSWVGIEWTPDFAPLPSNAIQTVTIAGLPTGGSFTLTYGGHTSGGIGINSTAAVMQGIVEAMPSIGTGNVLVGGPNGGPWTVTFINALSNEAISTMSATPSFTGGTSPTVTAITTTTGGVGQAPPLNPVLFEVTPAGVAGIDAVQTLTMIDTPTGGSFTLTFGGQTTSALAYDCAFSDVETALEALSSIGSNNVIVAGDGGVSGSASGPFTVTFTGTLAHQPITLMTKTNSLTGGAGTTPDVIITTSTPGAAPISATTNQYVPKIYYDTAGEVVLELTDGTTTKTYSVTLSPLFGKNQTLRIVAGWSYGPDQVFISVMNAQDGAILGTVTTNSPPLPPQVSFDGTISFTAFRGNFSAHVIKLENYSGPSAVFLSNPQIYVSPDPVVADASGNIPSTTLDNAIYAAAWLVQEEGTGGSHQTNFEDKVWTPIWADYLVQKGKLFFPAQISMKYLKLEFTNLTEESYPVYDSGIQVTYSTFPVSVTQGQTTTNMGLAGVASGLLSLGADVLLTGIGSVNWLNPSTVNAAVNSIFGQTTLTPVTVTTGAGSLTTLPNTTDLDLSGQTRQEVSTSWVYRRSPTSSSTLAAALLSVTVGGKAIQTLATAANTIGSAIANAFEPATNFVSNLATLGSQGSDWWVFPGGTLRMPAAIMNGLTAATQVVLGRPSTTTQRIRFSTTSVHRYTTRTVTRDAAVAYFAGLREVQPYVTTYIDGQDPATFSFSQYDLTQWVPGGAGIKQLDSGPITTTGALYELDNGQFDADISNWGQTQGLWSWDGTLGHWDLGTATVVADGTPKALQSLGMDVAPGATIDASVWVRWSGLTATSGSEAIQLHAQFYDSSGTFVSEQFVGLTNSPWPATTPESGGNVWAQIVSSATDSNEFTVPIGVTQMRLALVVTSAATAGQVWFDTVLVGTSDTVEGTVFKDFTTTSSFAKLELNFTDSGLVRSDSMWAQSDPNDSNVSSSALAYYTSTIPDVIPAGMWGDTIATWADPVITWGEPSAVVSIQVDPDRIYDNKRVLHFTRAAAAGEAGIKVRQVTNFIANGLVRMGAVFYKPTATDDQITLSLTRVSDGVVIHEETFTPVIGYWYNYVSSFAEIPDSEDQEYVVEILVSGDDADELYLNDLYCEVAGVRYFVQMGPEGGTNPQYDVTPLAYAGTAVCSCTNPVTEFSITTAIMTPATFAYTASATPIYLK